MRYKLVALLLMVMLFATSVVSANHKDLGDPIAPPDVRAERLCEIIASESVMQAANEFAIELIEQHMATAEITTYSISTKPREYVYYEWEGVSVNPENEEVEQIAGRGMPSAAVTENANVFLDVSIGENSAISFYFDSIYLFFGDTSETGRDTTWYHWHSEASSPTHFGLYAHGFMVPGNYAEVDCSQAQS
jgi:hypothetical protein